MRRIRIVRNPFLPEPPNARIPAGAMNPVPMPPNVKAMVGTMNPKITSRYIMEVRNPAGGGASFYACDKISFKGIPWAFNPILSESNAKIPAGAMNPTFHGEGHLPFQVIPWAFNPTFHGEGHLPFQEIPWAFNPRPPKEWWDRTFAKVKSTYSKKTRRHPRITSKKRLSQIVGKIWWRLSQAKRESLIRYYDRRAAKRQKLARRGAAA